MTTPHHEELRHRFDEDLHSIRMDTVRLGGLILENARRVSEAMLENDLDLGQQVLAADAEVDKLAAELERHAFETMALQQPMAGDLRFLVAITRMVYELERTGDLVANCAKAHAHGDGFALSPRARGLLAKAAKASSDVFAKGIEALADMNPDAGAELDRYDDTVDDLVSEFYTLLPTESEGSGLENAISLSRVARYLERIADHGVNVGQHVHYIVRGEFPGDARAAD